MENIWVKFGIQECDFHNSDEIGFMMDVTRADESERSKFVRPGIRERSTAIICTSGGGENIQPFFWQCRVSTALQTGRLEAAFHTTG